MSNYKGSRDSRFVTLRRGGTLKDSDHHLLAAWAADCADHVLHYFFKQRPMDNRPQIAIEQARAWSRGEISMTQAREAAYAAHNAAKETEGAACAAARSAGHAVAVAHMADHELGAAAYAIKAVREASPIEIREKVGKIECIWQRDNLPKAIYDLVISDQQTRNIKFWSFFDC
ncbi:MAG: hypothetical protein HON98_02195 [Chloroflexi bacterium]|jgi:hypothetical protein|nr:hypothetical protein [Chloroflexota bacterium]MBT3668656.1 hypothetical protein [Chloroflexota bacterium]MBT4001873.1 hypothetical protein [Chloroflexota bacterium]MBT4305357.1 hypothetical protein [Chloroflexota bacterium]MBT4532503.1 hypothetical protein [Chloroflexota bacterium]